VLLASFLLCVKSENKYGNRYFSLFLVLTAVNFSGWFVWTWFTGTQALELFRISFSFLEMPMFYFYVLATCYRNFTLKLHHILHVIPFLLFNLQAVFFGMNTSFIALTGDVQWLAYMILITLALYKFKRIYLQNCTDTGIQTYQWLAQLTFVFFVAGILANVKSLVGFTSYEQAFTVLQITVGISALSVSTWFVLKALSAPELFRGMSEELPLLESETELLDDSFEEKACVDKESAQNIAKIKEFMQRENPYLDPSLTLQKLAKQMQVPAKELSILINHKMGQHFFDFINRYRVNAAAKLLETTEKPKPTVLEILYKVGFNSKSSFNTAFKNQFGLTPTQYRKSL